MHCWHNTRFVTVCHWNCLVWLIASAKSAPPIRPSAPPSAPQMEKSPPLNVFLMNKYAAIGFLMLNAALWYCGLHVKCSPTVACSIWNVAILPLWNDKTCYFMPPCMSTLLKPELNLLTIVQYRPIYNYIYIYIYLYTVWKIRKHPSNPSNLITNMVDMVV